MKTQIIVTDLTRTYTQSIGIAGLTENYECYRLYAPPPGISPAILMRRNALVVFPFAMIEANLLAPRHDPPFTEDFSFDPFSLRFVFEETKCEEVLYSSSFESVSAIFEQKIYTDPRPFVLCGEGPRSLGTIQPHRIMRILCEPGCATGDEYQLVFTDQAYATYGLKISDLTWQTYCEKRLAEGIPPEKLSAQLSERLKNASVHLRVGLERDPKKPPEHAYMQITGVYSNPDYLEGETLATLLPKFEKPEDRPAPGWLSAYPLPSHKDDH